MMFAVTGLAQLVADVTQRWCAIVEPEALIVSCVTHVVGHDDRGPGPIMSAVEVGEAL